MSAASVDPPDHAPGRRAFEASRALLGSPRFTQALTEAIVGVALAAFAVRALLGWPGSLAVLAGLVVLAALSLASQPERIEWRGVLPISLIALFSLLTISVIWSQYTWATVGGIVYALAYGFLGVYLALVRDLIQLVRAVGNALRVILTTSFVLEVLSGIIFDTPLLWLGITGDLASGGPVQGLAGTRNAFAFLGALAVLSFWIEVRTRSVSRANSTYSLTLAGATIVFARSPVALLVLAAVLIVGLALVIIRRQKAVARRATQSVLLISAAVFGVLAWEDDHILVYGLRGNVLESRDLGDSWTEVETGITTSLMGGHALPGGGAVLVGANGAILTRPDADTPFTATAYEMSTGETPLLSGVLPVDDAGYLVIGDKGADLYRPK